MHNDNIGAVHLTVLSALPGRLRLQLEKPIEGEAIFLSIPGMQSCRYNPRIQTMLCCYDKAVISESDLLVRIGALYARLQQTAVLHVKHSEEEGFSMAPSGYLALGCIVLDGMMTLAGSTLTRYTRWLSAGATLTAVVEHAYQELHTRGSFDPEVMSVVYLINAIASPTAFRRVCWRGLSRSAATCCRAARGNRYIWFGTANTPRRSPPSWAMRTAAPLLEASSDGAWKS